MLQNCNTNIQVTTAFHILPKYILFHNMCYLHVFNIIMMPVWINYLIEKKVLFTPQMTHQEDVNQFEQGGAFDQETDSDTYTLNYKYMLYKCNIGPLRYKNCF